jgi:hypothetical protein
MNGINFHSKHVQPCEALINHSLPLLTQLANFCGVWTLSLSFPSFPFLHFPIFLHFSDLGMKKEGN